MAQQEREAEQNIQRLRQLAAAAAPAPTATRPIPTQPIPLSGEQEGVPANRQVSLESEDDEEETSAEGGE